MAVAEDEETETEAIPEVLCNLNETVTGTTTMKHNRDFTHEVGTKLKTNDAVCNYNLTVGATDCKSILNETVWGNTTRTHKGDFTQTVGT